MCACGDAGAGARGGTRTPSNTSDDARAVVDIAVRRAREREAVGCDGEIEASSNQWGENARREDEMRAFVTF